MFGLITLKAIATNIVSPLVIASRAFRDMFAVIKVRIARQTTHRRNFAEFVSDTDVETAREKWGASWASCPAHIPPTTPPAENFDVETGFFEDIGFQCFSPDPTFKNGDDSTSPPIPENEASRKVTEESTYPPIYLCTSTANPTRDMSKTPTQNARVAGARAKRHSILFGDDQKSGLTESIIVPSDTSLNVQNVFAQSEVQQKRILCARAIRHEKLFSNKSYTEAALSKSDLFLTAAALEATPSKGAVAGPEVVDHEIELDLGYFTAESYDDLPTPPSTPSRRARTVKSDSYGGSINYSLRRLSRNTQDFGDIVLYVKKHYEASSTPMIAQYPHVT